MKKFYIGNEASKAEKRGLAGEAFINRQIECVHISADRNGKYKTDREGVFLLFNEEHPYMPYRTYVCVPVVDKELNGECLGVLCFNSTYPSAFNSARVKEKLAILATRIASVLLIYEEIEKIGSQIGGHQVQLNPGGVVTSN